MQTRCPKCRHHKSRSELIGRCAMQSVTSVNDRENCEYFREEFGKNGKAKTK